MGGGAENHLPSWGRGVVERGGGFVGVDPPSPVVTTLAGCILGSPALAASCAGRWALPGGPRASSAPGRARRSCVWPAETAALDED